MEEDSVHLLDDTAGFERDACLQSVGVSSRRGGHVTLSRNNSCFVTSAECCQGSSITCAVNRSIMSDINITRMFVHISVISETKRIRQGNVCLIYLPMTFSQEHYAE